MTNERTRNSVCYNSVQEVAIHTETSLSALESLWNNNFDRICRVILSRVEKGKLHVLAAVVVGAYHDLIPGGSGGGIYEYRMAKRVYMKYRSDELGRRIAKKAQLMVCKDRRSYSLSQNEARGRKSPWRNHICALTSGLVQFGLWHHLLRPDCARINNFRLTAGSPIQMLPTSVTTSRIFALHRNFAPGTNKKRCVMKNHYF